MDKKSLTSILNRVLIFAVAAAVACGAGILPQNIAAQERTAQAQEAEPGEVIEVLGDMLAEPGAEEQRILVEGEVSDPDAALSVCANGITILQYDSEAEAEEAMASFQEDGYGSIPDEELTVTTFDSADTTADIDAYAVDADTFSTYEAEYMNLICNAEGDEDVIVAMIDSGVNEEYLDEDRFLTGYYAADGSTDTTDNYGHGTMTASIVVNYTGDNVSILPIKIMDSGTSSVSYAALIASFEYALEKGADVVNLSIGVDVSEDRNWRQSMNQMESYLGPYLDALIESGATVVCASGNSGISSNYVFPACRESSWTVSSIGESYELSYFSNYDNIDYCAPGENITVTDCDGTVETNSGTSFSAPLVSVVAAQLAGIGYDTNDERDEYLQTVCLDLGTSGYDRYYGYGLPQPEHNYKLTTTTATCQETGDSVYTCACGESYTVTGETIDHIAGDPVITDTEDGGQIWSYYCTMCGVLMNEVTYTAEEVAAMKAAEEEAQQDSGYTVPSKSTAASKISLTGATVSQVTQTMAKVSTDGDFADSAYCLLQAKVSKVTKTSLTVKFKKVSGAKSYVIYGAKCGKSNKYKKLKKLTGTSATFKKVAGKKVKKGTYYKFFVVALDANGKVIQTSKVVHAATNGGKKTNVKSIRIYKGSKRVTSLSLSAGSSVRIKTKTVKQVKSKKIQNHRKVKYESGNTSIATVNANGKIKAKKKGTCYIYAYAQNGKSAKVKITVK